MNKNIFLFIVICIFQMKSIAQPVLDSANTNPVIGNVFIVATCNGLSDPGLPGANQTWNLTGLASTNSSTYTCSSAIGSSFPSASIKMNAVTGSIYYNTFGSSLETSGVENSVGIVYAYSNPEKLINFPFQFGDSFTDIWANSFDNGLTTFRQGTSNVMADGYGTVILPIGSFGNVLRVKTVQTYTDSVPGLGVVYSYVNTIYHWYLPGQHQAIASLSSLVTNGASPVLYGSYLISLVTALPEIEKTDLTDIILYPNPATDQFIVHLENENEQPLFSLNDMTGRNIPINCTRKSATDFQIVPLIKASGMYMLHLTINGEVGPTSQILFLNK